MDHGNYFWDAVLWACERLYYGSEARGDSIRRIARTISRDYGVSYDAIAIMLRIASDSYIRDCR